MNAYNPIDELRAADPYPTEAPLPAPARSANDLFDEIVGLSAATTTSTDTNTNTNSDDPTAATAVDDEPISLSSHRRRRGRILLPAAAAAAGLFTVGALVLDSGSSPAALALVTDAAQTAASYESGRVTVSAEIVEAPGDNGPGSLLIDYRYDADDFAFDIDVNGFGVAGSDEDLSFAVLAVGESVYSSFDGSETFTEEQRTADALQRVVSGGFDTGNVDPDAVVELLRNTDGFERFDEIGDVTVYRGKLTLETLQQLEEGDVPAGLGMLVGDAADNDDIPDTIDVEVAITDGVLTSLTIDMDGLTATGPIDATIVTTFFDLGEPQNIAAPPAASIVDLYEGGGLMPDGFEEDLAIIEEAMIRRPTLCADVFVADESASDDAILAEIDRFTTCLDEAGETAAADAFRRMNSMSGALTDE